MYKVLYRAYRPETFNEVLGQNHIIRILKSQINENKTNHAYLFTGTRGTGKTTTARLLAKGLNCLSQEEKPCGQCENCISIKKGTFLDVIEIDGASNSGIENIREIRDSVKFPPSVGRKKIYIIDEVHMLSTGAFNAFLKTLEEPPEYVVFILATTEPHKLPATILSRCLRLDFRRVSEKELLRRMKDICQEQGVNVEENALRLVVANADGSVRDGLTLLEQCISTEKKEITREDVLETIGTVDTDIFLELTESTLNGEVDKGIVLIDNILSEGKDPRQILVSWLEYFRNIMLTKHLEKPENILNLSIENIEKIKEQGRKISIGDIEEGINSLAEMIQYARTSSQPRILLEMAYVNLCQKKAKEQTAKRKEVETNEQITKKKVPETKDETMKVKIAETKAMATEIPEQANYKESAMEVKDNAITTEDEYFASLALGEVEIIDAPSIEKEKIVSFENEKYEEKSRKYEEKNEEHEEDGLAALIEKEKRKKAAINEREKTEEESISENQFSKSNEKIKTEDKDFQNIWTRMVEEGTKEKASFTMLTFDVVPLEITGEEFIVAIPETQAEVAENYLNTNKDFMEKLFETCSGFKRTLKINKIKEDEEKYKSKEELAEILGTIVEEK